MLGHYSNFPVNTHFVQTFQTVLSRGKLQEKIVSALWDTNRQNFSFDDVGAPAVPDCTVVFEFGIADGEAFSYLDEAEANRLRSKVTDEPLKVMDWFCSVRYYKDRMEKRAPLRFDYYMFRLVFSEKGYVEIQVFHERGPRYISPEDLALFFEHSINLDAGKKILKRTEIS